MLRFRSQKAIFHCQDAIGKGPNAWVVADDENCFAALACGVPASSAYPMTPAVSVCKLVPARQP